MNEHVRTNKIMVGFLCGAAVGVGIALLTAPSSGEVMRRRIGIMARGLANSARLRFDGMLGQFGDLRRDLRCSMAHGAEEIGATNPCFVG